MRQLRRREDERRGDNVAVVDGCKGEHARASHENENEIRTSTAAGERLPGHQVRRAGRQEMTQLKSK